jgi:predicted small metal-binding protein
MLRFSQMRFVTNVRGIVMTKVLRCGDLMHGCEFEARAESEDELMQKAAQHAREAHSMETLSPEVVQLVKSKIRDES